MRGNVFTFDGIAGFDDPRPQPGVLNRTVYMEDGSIWSPKGGLLRFTIHVDPCEPSWIHVVLESDCCEEMCWFDWELEAVTPEEILFDSCQPGEIAKWMLENGIAFDQPFWLDMSFSAGSSHTLDSVYPEYWTEVDYEVVKVEWMHPDDVATSWEAFLGRCFFLLGG